MAIKYSKFYEIIDRTGSDSQDNFVSTGFGRSARKPALGDEGSRQRRAREQRPSDDSLGTRHLTTTTEHAPNTFLEMTGFGARSNAANFTRALVHFLLVFSGRGMVFISFR